jgi:hypothetical protein
VEIVEAVLIRVALVGGLAVAVIIVALLAWALFRPARPPGRHVEEDRIRAQGGERPP